MPKGSAWTNFIYVNLGFALQVFAMYFFMQIQEIKDNWPIYRCNPMYMPLADDVGSNFVYCVQSMQTNFMGYLLEPLMYIISGLNVMSFGFLNDIGNVRNMFGYIRDMITSIIGNVFTVFLNIVIEFQKIMLGIKDIMGKIVGIVVTMMYVLDGSLKTMNSAWNGPPGQMVQVMGSCFHPETKVKLENGKVKEMQNLNLGDVLENGSIIRALMKVSNSTNETFYTFKNDGVDKEDIFVTGSHMVLDKNGKYIKVKDHPESIENPAMERTWFSCLITDDHKIQIGNKTFWDWEDYKLNR